VKVWIYKGEVLPDQPRGEREVQGRPGAAGDAARFRDNRRGTRGGRGRGEGRPAGAPRADEAPAIDTADAMRAALTEGPSLESVIEGGAPVEHHHTGAHAGAVTHEPSAEHGHGVTTETSVVPPETQATHDDAERPGAPSVENEGQ
jgi:hypothetical protein